MKTRVQKISRETKKHAAKYAVAKYKVFSADESLSHFENRIEAIGCFFNAYLYLCGKKVEDNE